MRNGIVPIVIEDVNRNEYLDVLKAYREEKSNHNKLTKKKAVQYKFRTGTVY